MKKLAREGNIMALIKWNFSAAIRRKELIRRPGSAEFPKLSRVYPNPIIFLEPELTS